jgi:hypothetical protein
MDQYDEPVPPPMVVPPTPRPLFVEDAWSGGSSRLPSDVQSIIDAWSSSDNDAPSSTVPSTVLSTVPSSFPSLVPSDAPSNIPSDVSRSDNPSDAPSELPSAVFVDDNTVEENAATDKYCVAPKDEQDTVVFSRNLRQCRDVSATMHFDLHERQFSSECGPNCRPSCVTLLLDLDKLNYANDLVCERDRLCHCNFKQRLKECKRRDALLSEYPTCTLEKADCLGPAVYDDAIAYLEKASGIQLSGVNHCSSIPDEELYCRFQDWKLIMPMSVQKCDEDGGNCFDDETKIYFEYCNIVNEDPVCEKCGDDDDNDKCG